MVMRFFNSTLILILLLMPAVSMAAKLEAVPDRTRVGLEESFNLELRANGSVDGSPDLSVLERDFELLGRSQSSQIQIINGDYSRTTTWSLSLLARSPGRKTIPPLCVENDCSAPVAIEVLPAGQGSAAVGGNNDLLLEVSAEPDKLWVQSQLLYKVRLLTRLNFLQASLSEPEPSGIEAVVQKLGEDRNYETERNGLRYRVVERSYAIFPQQSGQLTIPPVQFAAQVAEGGRGSFDPFNQRTRQLRKRSDAINAKVLPAPDSGGHRWLPTNGLRLADDWQQKPPQLTVGEPATRTITLRVAGQPAAQLPLLAVEPPEGGKSYPDQPTREDQFDEHGITGTLQQKLALVPTRPGPLLLPQVTIDWWDLKTESWQKTSLPAIELEVLPATSQPAAATAQPAEQQKAAKVEQAPQIPGPQDQGSGQPEFWPWLALALACGWLLTLLLLVKGKLAQRRREPVQTEEKQVPNLRQARQALDRALQSSDRVQVRHALLAWGKALFPDRSPGNLEALAALCGPPLQEQLESFNRSLYSRDNQTWDARKLLAAVQQVQQQQAGAKDIDQLPPLYPR